MKQDFEQPELEKLDFICNQKKWSRAQTVKVLYDKGIKTVDEK